jgi:MoxR-like ATPase
MTATTLRPQRHAFATEATVAAATRIRRATGQHGTALDRLVQLFRLNQRERDLLETCVAASIDPTLGASFAGIEQSGGHGWVTDPLVAAIFGHPASRVWNPAGALALWQLVRAQPVGPGEPDALTIDPVVPAWLAGELWVDRGLAGLVRKADAAPDVLEWPVAEVATAVRRAVTQGMPIRIAVRGARGDGRTPFSAAVAASAGLPALIVETSAVDDADWPDVFVRLQRLAAVGGTALIWAGMHAHRTWPTTVAPSPVHFLPLEHGQVLPPSLRMVTTTVDLPEPSIAARSRLWLQNVPNASTWPATEIEQLAARYRLGAGAILEIARERPASPLLAAELARGWNRRAAEDVAHVVPCPFAWDDLVVPASLKETLADFAFEALERERVREDGATERLLTRDASLVALFAGPSGTGKTMAAQVIAAHLGLDLLRVDLAAVTSKYIGETAKNLNRVFALARGRQAILLFDEADSQFARRTEVKDAHDRYANSDTNHLLQLLEMHSGLVILATNRRSDMDPAFVRRLRFVLEFPRPQGGERLELWRRALQAIADDERCRALEPTIAAIAEAIDVSGAQIKNAALSALFAARRQGAALDTEHLLRGIDRELAKEGRPLPARDRERWLRHA